MRGWSFPVGGSTPDRLRWARLGLAWPDLRNHANPIQRATGRRKKITLPNTRCYFPAAIRKNHRRRA